MMVVMANKKMMVLMAIISAMILVKMHRIRRWSLTLETLRPRPSSSSRVIIVVTAEQLSKN